MAPGDDARAAAPHAAGTLAGKLTIARRDGRDERMEGEDTSVDATRGRWMASDSRSQSVNPPRAKTLLIKKITFV